MSTWIQRLVGAVALGASVSGGRAPEARSVFREIHMGMEVRLTVYAPSDSVARLAADRVFGELARLEDILSDWRGHSAVRQLVRPVGTWQSLSPELRDVLAISRRVAEHSGGAFDPTVGPLVAEWRKALASGRLPDSLAIAGARARVGHHMLELDSAGRRARVLREGMLLDLGGVAKGYMLQRAADAARAVGVRRLLIEAGGDLVAGDPPPGRSGWRVDAPLATRGVRRAAQRLANRALATSGPSAQFVEIGGRRYSHVVDPRTGWALTDARVASVISRNAALADAVATALTVLSAAEGRRLLDAVGIAASDVSVR